MSKKGNKGKFKDEVPPVEPKKELEKKPQVEEAQVDVDQVDVDQVDADEETQADALESDPIIDSPPSAELVEESVEVQDPVKRDMKIVGLVAIVFLVVAVFFGVLLNRGDFTFVSGANSAALSSEMTVSGNSSAEQDIVTAEEQNVILEAMLVEAQEKLNLSLLEVEALKVSIASSQGTVAVVEPVSTGEGLAAEQGDDGDLVDLSAPEKTVSGYPASASKEEQVAWMSDLAVANVNKIEDEPAGFYVNSKEAGDQKAVCPEGAVCTWHLVDNRIVYFRGHNEVYSILAGTWRVEDQYPESICVMASNALENSIDEQFTLEFLGDINDLCPNIFATGDPSKGEETILMSELTDVPLIRISTEPGAWDINSKGVGLESFICIEGTVCTIHLEDDSIIFVIGNGQQFNAWAATIRLLKHYDETACQIWHKEQANGATAHESVTCQ